MLTISTHSVPPHPRQWLIPRASLRTPKKPHSRHTGALDASELCISRSTISDAAPCEIRQSRSISPSRSAPSWLLPALGCLVTACVGPRAREWSLSHTWCLSTW